MSYTRGSLKLPALPVPEVSAALSCACAPIAGLELGVAASGLPAAVINRGGGVEVVSVFSSVGLARNFVRQFGNGGGA